MDGSIAIDRLESSDRINVTIAQDEIEHELEQLHRQSFGWALACCGRNPDEAEDVLQMTYVKILDGTARFEGRSSFQTWLFGVIRRTALQRRRKIAVRERLLRLLFIRQGESFTPGPDATLEYALDSKRLIQARSASSSFGLVSFAIPTIRNITARRTVGRAKPASVFRCARRRR